MPVLSRLNFSPPHRRALLVAAGLLLVAASTPAQEAAPAAQPATPQQPPAATQASGGAAPKLQLETTEWDFGTVWYGDPAQTEVEIKNVGQAPLAIKQVHSSCGCTVAQPSKKTLAPGESDKIRITYNTRKPAAHVSQTITIETDDPAQPNATIRVKGNVKPVFEGKPSLQISFGQIPLNADKSQSIELVNNYDKPATLKLGTIPANVKFDFKLEELEPGKRYKLTATTKPPMSTNYNGLSLPLQTGLADKPTIEVPVSCIALPRVSVTPPRVLILPNQKGNLVRKLRVNYLRSQPVEILEAKASIDSIKVTLEPRVASPAASGEFESRSISVVPPVWDELPEDGATIEITTNDPDPQFQKLVVPVSRAPLPPSQARKPTAAGQPRKPR